MFQISSRRGMKNLPPIEILFCIRICVSMRFKWGFIRPKNFSELWITAFQTGGLITVFFPFLVSCAAEEKRADRNQTNVGQSSPIEICFHDHKRLPRACFIVGDQKKSMQTCAGEIIFRFRLHGVQRAGGRGTEISFRLRSTRKTPLEERWGGASGKN